MNGFTLDEFVMQSAHHMTCDRTSGRLVKIVKSGVTLDYGVFYSDGRRERLTPAQHLNAELYLVAYERLRRWNDEEPVGDQPEDFIASVVAA